MGTTAIWMALAESPRLQSRLNASTNAKVRELLSARSSNAKLREDPFATLSVRP
jgi:hypothetical protein